MATSLTITRHDGSLGELAPVWGVLLDPEHPGAAFRSYAWISAWWRHASSRLSPWVLVARDGARIAAILPMYAERTILGGTRLRLMGDDIVGSDYVGVVAARGDEARAVSAFAAHLAMLGPDEILLDGLFEDDPLARALPGATVTPRYLCPFVATSGSFEAYLAGRPAGAGAQLRRRLRWLERQPGFALEELRAPGEVARGIEVLIRLHRARWALEGGSEAIDGRRVENLHRDAAAGLARAGWARVWQLSACGAPRAVLYGFRHGSRVAFYQAGHEPAWRPRSVGTVLLGHVLERCFDEGVAEFDFLRGSESYKQTWATGARRTVAVQQLGPGARAWLGNQGHEAWTLLRRAVKARVPGAAVELFRRTRRAVARAA